MATPTYDLLASSVLTSATSSVTFSSISQDYRDLILVCDYKANASTVSTRVRFNSDSGSNYPVVYMQGDGSTTPTGAFTTSSIFSQSASTTAAELVTVQIMDYSATDKHKSVLSRFGRASDSVSALAGRWANTSAITSVAIEASSANNFASGSSFYLYGISA